MPSILDFLFQGGQGGGLLGGFTGPNGQGGPQSLPDMFGGNQGMMLAGLGLASGSTPGEGFKNMLPALQSAFEQQKAQQAGMALLNALPGGSAPASPAAAPAGMPQPMALGANGQPLRALDGGIMPAGMGEPSSYSRAIAANESGGDYKALGPVIPKTGDRAYGKYQVMGSNVPQWTQEVLGRPMTPQQFVASPEAQEAVFKAKFGQYVQKYGPEGASRAWFAGEEGMNNPNARDPLGTTVAGYSQKFMANGGGDPSALPPNATPTQGQAPPTQGYAVPGQPGPQLGGNMPGSGLQLIDSPALQGMPATVRKAIPVMLASKQYAPQAMAMIQKYINPEQWQLYRDSMGNVFTRNSATGESKPLIQATPQMMNANASGLPTPLAYEAATSLAGSAAKNTELTTEQKNANASAGMTPVQYEGAKQEATATGTILADQFKTITNAGISATKKLGTLQRMSQLNEQAYEGAAAPAVQHIRSALATFGLDAGKVPAGEEFTALANKMTMDGLNGSLGTGVSNADTAIIANMNPNLSHTAAGRKEIIQTATLLAKRDQTVAKMASEYRAKNGGSLAGFDSVLADFAEKNPLFAGRENKIAAPTGGPDPAAIAEAKRRGLIK